MQKILDKTKLEDLEFVGMQDGHGVVENVFMFHDGQTRSTLALPSSKCTVEGVRVHVLKSRNKFKEGRL